MRMMNVLTDRLLEMVAPRVTAAASSRTDYCYFVNCQCISTLHEMLQQYCCFTNGRHECSPCENWGATC